MLTPNPNECNSTLTSGTKNIYPYPYIDVNDRGHRLGFIQPPRRHGIFRETKNKMCYTVENLFVSILAYSISLRSPQIFHQLLLYLHCTVR